jgi:hypothetical protein
MNLLTCVIDKLHQVSTGATTKKRSFWFAEDSSHNTCTLWPSASHDYQSVVFHLSMVFEQ